MGSLSSDIGFVKVIKPNDDFDEHFYFIVQNKLDLSNYYLESPAGTKYEFEDIIFLPSSSDYIANEGDIIRIFTEPRDSIKYKYQDGSNEYIGTLNNGCTVGNTKVEVYRK